MARLFQAGLSSGEIKTPQKLVFEINLGKKSTWKSMLNGNLENIAKDWVVFKFSWQSQDSTQFSSVHCICYTRFVRARFSFTIWKTNGTNKHSFKSYLDRKVKTAYETKYIYISAETKVYLLSRTDTCGADYLPCRRCARKQRLRWRGTERGQGRRGRNRSVRQFGV